MISFLLAQMKDWLKVLKRMQNVFSFNYLKKIYIKISVLISLFKKKK